MDFDGFLKLIDAERNVALTRANVANTMADVATKIANLSLIREQVIKARLDNVAKFLDISWDAQAHRDLLRIRNLARRKAREAERNAELVQQKLRHLSAVLSGGGSFQGICDGWLAFAYFQKQVLLQAATSIAQIEMGNEIYGPGQWFAPDNKQIKPIPSDEHDFGHLIDWARRGSYVPKMQTPAWKVFAAYIKALSDAAGARAATVQREVDEAAAAALALSKEDWSRLKTDEQKP